MNRNLSIQEGKVCAYYAIRVAIHLYIFGLLFGYLFLCLFRQKAFIPNRLFIHNRNKLFYCHRVFFTVNILCAIYITVDFCFVNRTSEFSSICLMFTATKWTRLGGITFLCFFNNNPF